MLTARRLRPHDRRMKSLINALREAERAEAAAVRLRREHGALAEAVCETERDRHPRTEPGWRFWADVRRSLKWVKAREAEPQEG